MRSQAFRIATASYLRSFIFGVEDSLVSTVGLLSGIAIAGVPQKTIFLTGVVLIFVEAFSMAAGSFLSESSVEEYVGKTDRRLSTSIQVGIVMFFSYFLSGFVPLFPYVLLPVDSAFPVSVISSLAALFALGAWGGSISHKNLTTSALRMFIIGGVAIGVGIIVGWLVH
jgi:vacuolar iron transporter family protein